MGITINESNKYYITGKIIDINDSIFTISVTSPFTREIKFHCRPEHYDMLHNSTQEQKKYWFFRDKYISILQKEQLCHFSAYAIDTSNKDWHSVRNQEVDRHPDDYHYLWIYDPDSFYAEKWDEASIDDLVKEIRPSRDCLKQLLKSEKWDEASIDDLVKETRPSRDCLKQLLKSYEDDDWEAFKNKCKRIWETIKSTPKRLQNWLDEYDKLMIAVITLVSGAVGVELIKVIIKIITPSEN